VQKMMRCHVSSATNVIGKQVIQTRSRSRTEQSKIGMEVLPQLCDADGTSGGSGRPDRMRHEENLCGWPDSETEHVSGRRKFRPGRKRPRK